MHLSVASAFGWPPGTALRVRRLEGAVVKMRVFHSSLQARGAVLLAVGSTFAV